MNALMLGNSLVSSVRGIPPVSEGLITEEGVQITTEELEDIYTEGRDES